MALSERKEQILAAIVDSYIERCEPISSMDISKDSRLPALSSATIRNELAALEEMGYLSQPHTSAGRVPTAQAYKLYVERLMPKTRLSESELAIVKKYFDKKITELDDILKSTVKVITEVTNLTSVAYARPVKNSVIQSIKFVPVSSEYALVVIVTDVDILKDAVMTIPPSLSENDFLGASEFVTSVFRGRAIGEVSESTKIIQEIKQEFVGFYDFVFKILSDYATDKAESGVVMEGQSKILEQPEYANLGKAKAMLNILESKDKLVPILCKSGDMNLNIQISQDDEIEKGVPECAIVTATYSLGGKEVGNAGVIGPMRMDYPKIISLLDYIGKTIDTIPKEPYKEDSK
ncbi:MAG: heat-inducible transcriptional repressor HrcA [Firmicutes bacterium]|nr:heat-inducible transcriptional repressor HrcA [Bacillota bacterium]